MRRIAVVAAVVMAAGSARAADLSPEDLKKALDAAKVSVSQAIETARQAVTEGMPFKVKLDIKGGQYIYSIKVFTGDLQKTARIDAVTGKVVSVDDVTMNAQRKEEMALVRPLMAAAKVSLAKATEAAAAGIADSRVYQAEPDVDEGKLIYEVMLLTGSAMVEAEVDATMGTLGKITRQVPISGEPARPFGFDKDAAGSLPAGWKAAGTGQSGPVATWQVVADPSAPSAPNALALTASHGSSTTFNICWTDRIRFQDGAIEVAMKAESGAEDQGGGVIWRVRDHDNYYICRANPLESNLRVYVVTEGLRKQLASAQLDIPSTTWHTIKIEHQGAHIICSLDGQKLLEADDATLPLAGGVGLWTKADAVTNFDDLKVTPGPAK